MMIAMSGSSVGDGKSTPYQSFVTYSSNVGIPPVSDKSFQKNISAKISTSTLLSPPIKSYKKRPAPLPPLEDKTSLGFSASDLRTLKKTVPTSNLERGQGVDTSLSLTTPILNRAINDHKADEVGVISKKYPLGSVMSSFNSLIGTQKRRAPAPPATNSTHVTSSSRATIPKEAAISGNGDNDLRGEEEIRLKTGFESSPSPPDGKQLLSVGSVADPSARERLQGSASKTVAITPQEEARNVKPKVKERTLKRSKGDTRMSTSEALSPIKRVISPSCSVSSPVVRSRSPDNSSPANGRRTDVPCCRSETKTGFNAQNSPMLTNTDALQPLRQQGCEDKIADEKSKHQQSLPISSIAPKSEKTPRRRKLTPAVMLSPPKLFSRLPPSPATVCEQEEGVGTVEPDKLSSIKGEAPDVPEDGLECVAVDQQTPALGVDRQKDLEEGDHEHDNQHSIKNGEKCGNEEENDRRVTKYNKDESKVAVSVECGSQDFDGIETCCFDKKIGRDESATDILVTAIVHQPKKEVLNSTSLLDASMKDAIEINQDGKESTRNEEILLPTDDNCSSSERRYTEASFGPSVVCDKIRNVAMVRQDLEESQLGDERNLDVNRQSLHPQLSLTSANEVPRTSSSIISFFNDERKKDVVEPLEDSFTTVLNFDSEDDDYDDLGFSGQHSKSADVVANCARECEAVGKNNTVVVDEDVEKKKSEISKAPICQDSKHQVRGEINKMGSEIPKVKSSVDSQKPVIRSGSMNFSIDSYVERSSVVPYREKLNRLENENGTNSQLSSLFSFHDRAREVDYFVRNAQTLDSRHHRKTKTLSSMSVKDAKHIFTAQKPLASSSSASLKQPQRSLSIQELHKESGSSPIVFSSELSPNTQNYLSKSTVPILSSSSGSIPKESVHSDQVSIRPRKTNSDFFRSSIKREQVVLSQTVTGAERSPGNPVDFIASEGVKTHLDVRHIGQKVASEDDDNTLSSLTSSSVSPGRKKTSLAGLPDKTEEKKVTKITDGDEKSISESSRQSLLVAAPVIEENGNLDEVNNGNASDPADMLLRRMPPGASDTRSSSSGLVTTYLQPVASGGHPSIHVATWGDRCSRSTRTHSRTIPQHPNGTHHRSISAGAVGYLPVVTYNNKTRMHPVQPTLPPSVVVVPNPYVAVAAPHPLLPSRGPRGLAEKLTANSNGRRCVTTQTRASQTINNDDNVGRRKSSRSNLEDSSRVGATGNKEVEEQRNKDVCPPSEVTLTKFNSLGKDTTSALETDIESNVGVAESLTTKKKPVENPDKIGPGSVLSKRSPPQFYFGQIPPQSEMSDDLIISPNTLNSSVSSSNNVKAKKQSAIDKVRHNETLTHPKMHLPPSSSKARTPGDKRQQPKENFSRGTSTGFFSSPSSLSSSASSPGGDDSSCSSSTSSTATSKIGVINFNNESQRSSLSKDDEGYRSSNSAQGGRIKDSSPVPSQSSSTEFLVPRVISVNNRSGVISPSLVKRQQSNSEICKVFEAELLAAPSGIEEKSKKTIPWGPPPTGGVAVMPTATTATGKVVVVSSKSSVAAAPEEVRRPKCESLMTNMQEVEEEGMIGPARPPPPPIPPLSRSIIFGEATPNRMTKLVSVGNKVLRPKPLSVGSGNSSQLKFHQAGVNTQISPREELMQAIRGKGGVKGLRKINAS